MTRMDQIDPIAELKATAARPFTQAMAMPPGVYTSEAVTQAELDRIFARDWICVGRAESLARPGDYLTYELAGQPIAVVKDKEGTSRAVFALVGCSGSWRHRGSGNWPSADVWGR